MLFPLRDAFFWTNATYAPENTVMCFGFSKVNICFCKRVKISPKRMKKYKNQENVPFFILCSVQNCDKSLSKKKKLFFFLQISAAQVKHNTFLI